jgi:glycosyltransferase involved in cell wall biosynthesis
VLVEGKIKVIRIITRLNNGGPARHVIWLTSGLDRNKFESILVSGVVESNEDDLTAEAMRYDISPVMIFLLKRSISPFYDIFTLVRILLLFFREKPDIIHTHTSKAGFLGRSAGFIYSFFHKCSTIHTFHGHTFHSYFSTFKGGFFLLIEKILARLATDKIIVISKLQFDEIHKKFGIGCKDQYEIVPLGIDLSEITQDGGSNSFKEELQLQEFITIGIIGRIAPVKNHKMFIDITALLTRDLGEQRVKFIIIGGGAGEDMTMLRNYAKEQGVEDRVIFTGNRYDTSTFYLGLDIVALTSLNEGTPLSLIEAMAVGRPFVATDVGGVRDLTIGYAQQLEGGMIRIYDNGILVNSGDTTSFAQALSILIKDEKLRLSMGKYGQEFVKQKHSKERLISDIEKIYLTLVR